MPGVRKIVPFLSGATLVGVLCLNFDLDDRRAQRLRGAPCGRFEANTGWAEGFDTRDLKEAKALLEELAA